MLVLFLSADMCGFEHALYKPQGRISEPHGKVSGGSLEPKAKSGGVNCCGSPKTKGESEYGYEMKGKRPDSHVVDIEGGDGRFNAGYDGPDVRVDRGGGKK